MKRGERKPVISTTYGERHNSPEIRLRCVEKVQLVQRRYARDKYAGQTTSGCDSRLYNVVLTRAKVASEDRKVRW